MKLLTFVFVLALIKVSQQVPIAAVVPVAIKVSNIILSTIEIGILFSDITKYKTDGGNMEFVTSTLRDITKNMKQSQANFELRLNQLHSTVSMQFYYENVGFRAHTTFVIAEKYVESQTNFTRELLLNECLRNPPHATFTILDSLLSDNFFLLESRRQNCRFRDVEKLRTIIEYSLEQSIFSHFVCMSIQNEPINNTITTMVIETTKNISVKLNKQIDEIKETFFPKYVAQEVISLLSTMDFPLSAKERNALVSNSTAFLLTENYAHGIFPYSAKRAFPNFDYSVFVGKQSTVYGILPEDHILHICHDDFLIMIYRSNVSRVNVYESNEEFVNNLITNVTCNGNITKQFLNACTKHEFCGITNHDSAGSVFGHNNMGLKVAKVCGSDQIIFTGLPLGSSPMIPASNLTAEDKKYVKVLQSVRRKRRELETVKAFELKKLKDKTIVKKSDLLTQSNVASKCTTIFGVFFIIFYNLIHNFQ